LPTMSSRTAWITLIFGGIIGVLFWILQNAVPGEHVANYGFSAVLTFNILHYSILSFVLCSVVLGASHFYETSFAASSADETVRLVGENFEAVVAKQQWAGRTTQGFAVGVMAVTTALVLYHSQHPGPGVVPT